MIYKYFVCLCIILFINCNDSQNSIGYTSSDSGNISEKQKDNNTNLRTQREVLKLEKQFIIPEDKAIFFLSLSSGEVHRIEELEKTEQIRIREETIELLEKYIKEHSEDDNQWMYGFLGRAYLNKEGWDNFDKAKTYFIKGLNYEFSRFDCAKILYKMCISDTRLVGVKFYNEILSYVQDFIKFLPNNKDALIMLRIVQKSDPEDDKTIRDLLLGEKRPNENDYLTEEEYENEGLSLGELEETAVKFNHLAAESLKKNMISHFFEQKTKEIIYWKDCLYKYHICCLSPYNEMYFRDWLSAGHLDFHPKRVYASIGGCYVEYAKMTQDSTQKIQLYKTAIYYYRKRFYLNINYFADEYRADINDIRQKIEAIKSQTNQPKDKTPTPK